MLFSNSNSSRIVAVIETTVATAALITTISISVTITMIMIIIMIDHEDGQRHYLSRPVLFTVGKLNSSCFNYNINTISIVFKSKLSSFFHY